jgi:hypothetical protein
MKTFMKLAGRQLVCYATVGVLSSTAIAQQAPIPNPAPSVATNPLPPDQTLVSPTFTPVPNTPTQIPQGVALPLQTPQTSPVIVFQAPPVVPGQTPTNPSVMSSQPPPFQITPDRPAATNDPNFFNGFPQVQDAFSRMSPGNYLNTKYKWYGFVRVDGIFDNRPIGGTDSFVTSQIPIPQGRGQNTAFTPRYSRLGWDTETPLSVNDWTMKTRIEIDFFNGNNSGSFGSFPLRLRFAWADFGPFLIGQAASLFMDYDVFPNVLDYQGPSGMVLMRQPIISMHFPMGEKLRFSMGVEQPYSDIQWLENGTWVANPGSGIITTPGVARNVQDVPDMTANVRYTGEYGHVQVAGIARKLTYQPATGDGALDELGYGVNWTGTFHPWACMHGVPTTGDCATPLSKSRFLYQFAAGRGINRYIQDENGLALDATFDPINGFRAIPSYGWFVAYEQWWAKKWASVLTYSRTGNELTNTLPGSTYDESEYISGNIIWLPVERMGVGLECLHGFRKNLNGEKAENTRIQMAFQYKF